MCMRVCLLFERGDLDKYVLQLLGPFRRPADLITSAEISEVFGEMQGA
jgi:hypothetical protein